MKLKTKLAAVSAVGLSGGALAGGGVLLASLAVNGRRSTYEETLSRQKKWHDVDWYFPLEKEDYTVRSYDGYVLHVQLCKNPEPSDKYVILSHGYTDTRLGTLKYVKLYLDRGYNCVIYDLRGHGANEKAACTYSAREGKDLYELIRDTRQRYENLRVLGLHGESLGAATTASSLGYQIWAKADGLKASGTVQEGENTVQEGENTVQEGENTVQEEDAAFPVDFAVCDCGFADFTNVLEGVVQGMLDRKEWNPFHFGQGEEGGSDRGVKTPSLLAKLAVRYASTGSSLRYGYSFDAMKPVSHLTDNHVPMLFIHGGADTFVLPENSRRMAAATAGYCEYHVIPGADHAQSVLKDPERYKACLYGFLDHVGC